jgi:hypothetical protein
MALSLRRQHTLQFQPTLVQALFLLGYCNAPQYVLLDGPTAYWAPMVGCNYDKADCCPYTVAQQTSAALATGITVPSYLQLQ